MWSNTDKIRYFHKHTGNNGGFTVAYVTNENGTIEWNYARCNEVDNFSRKIGRSIASGRLVSNKIKNFYFTLSRPEFLSWLNQFKDYKLSLLFPIECSCYYPEDNF